ncbi:MAG: hypothetical protein WAT56_01610, partial [Candidatus Microthrix parvicella]
RDTGRGGDGAIITATYRVTPGAAVEARRHPGGPAQTAGNAGGAGGDAIEVRIGGSSKVFAGGGGGGANNSDDFPPGENYGRGGNAGLLSAAGTANGQGGTSGNGNVPSGSIGGAGHISESGSGGNGGTAAAAGAGGAGNDANGSPGSGSNGGLGGPGQDDFGIIGDPGSGGSGGAGLFGGGGGGPGDDALASQTAVGGGGGAGSSSVSATNLVTGSIQEVASTVNYNVSSSANPGSISSNEDNNVGSTITWHPCAYDLGITKVADRLTTLPGGAASWKIRVTNYGPDNMSANTAAPGVGIPGNRDTTVISDVLPAGASFGTLPANCRSGPGPSAVTCFDIPGVVTAQNPSGSSSNFVEIPVTLAVPSGALAGTCYTNSASIDAQRPPLPGGDVRPNDATANSVCVVADTGLTKTSSSGTVQRGGSVDFTLTLTAYSPLPNGAIPTIIDTGLQSLPPGYSVSAATIAGTAASAGCAEGPLQVVQCTGSMATGQTVTIKYTLSVPCTALFGTTFFNGASAQDGILTGAENADEAGATVAVVDNPSCPPVGVTGPTGATGPSG